MAEQINAVSMTAGKLKNIFSNTQDGIMIVGGNGKLVYGNGNAASILGTPMDENMAIALMCERVENENFVQTILDALRDAGRSVKRQVDYMPPDGKKLRTLELTVTRIEEDGEKSVIAVFSDVTERELLRLQKRNSVQQLTAMMLLLVIYNFFFVLFPTSIPVSPVSQDRNDALTWSIMAVGMGLGVVVLRGGKFTARDLGLWSDTMVKDCLISLGFSAAIFVSFLLIKVACLALGIPIVPEGTPLIVTDPKALARHFINIYPIMVVMQEFLARSIMQSSLMRIYDGKYNVVIAIFVSSQFFGALHVGYGWAYMIGAVIIMGVFGIYFNKCRNIWAMAIIHYAVTTSGALLGII